MKVEIKHSESKPAWNIVGTRLGRKHKIARFPYVPSDDEELATLNKAEALTHARICVGALNREMK